MATLRLDSASIISGLIHDTVEDTAPALSDVEARFGKEVATIVDGVTKWPCGSTCHPEALPPHHGLRTRGAALRDPGPHRGDAPDRCGPNELWLLAGQTG
ncbi:MAG: HD domain-containing protein [Longimicrobiales bacterium]|nr:HD domain-containing protein [Longimicrobiales bacterium]